MKYTGFTVGDDLRIELINNEDGSRIRLESFVNNYSFTYIGTYPELPGNYQDMWLTI